MKTKAKIMCSLAAIVACLLTNASTPLYGQAVWTATANGTNANWSSAAAWQGGIAPAADGTATVSFESTAVNAYVTSNVDSAWSLSPSVHGLVFGTSTSLQNNYTLVSTSSLTIGAGGVTAVNNNGSSNNRGVRLSSASIVLGADQSWTTNGGYIETRTLSGARSLTFSAGATGGYLRMTEANNSAFTGGLRINSGTLYLNASNGSNLAQLGSAAVTLAGSTIEVNNAANGSATFSNSISFNGGSSNIRSSGSGTILNMAGELAGTFGSLHLYAGSSEVESSLNRMVIARDNSTLTTSATLQAVGARSGTVVIGSQNALGANNSLSLGVGNANSLEVCYKSSVLVRDGIAYNGRVDFALNQRASAGALQNVARIGTDGVGASTFAGDIYIASVNPATPTTYVANRLPLSVINNTAGGRTIITGRILDGGAADAQKGELLVNGGGVTEIRNNGNTYGGPTTVLGGSRLIANNTAGSATGRGSVYVGANAATRLGDLTTANTAIAGASGLVTGVTGKYYVTVSTTSGLRVGQAVSGSGIAANTYVVGIKPWGQQYVIQLSEAVTASGTGVNLAFAQSAGVLGGSGIIRPEGVNGITVANGSSIFPGADAATATTLRLDAGGTTGNLLTMESGSFFEFNLFAGNQSDQISILNYTIGDMMLSNNLIKLNNLQQGVYELFNIYSDGGTTLATTDLDSADFHLDDAALSVAGLIGELDFSTSGKVILTIVPEPTSIATLMMGLGMAAIASRLRRRG